MNKAIHIRRCHVCGEVSESADDILKCSHCKKSLLPFFYFDKKKVRDYSDNEERPMEAGSPSSSEYGPIRGLTAYWEMESP